MFKDIYKGKKVLITGHTGFKGSWLTSWLYSLNANIIGVSKDIPSSPSMFEVLELEEKIQHHFVDIRNYEELHNIIDTQKPDFIFHAAAYKHVPLMEKENVSEALLNNSLGTYVLANICQKLKVKKFVLISTDKAINATNVMGASKRLAEIFCKKLQNKNGTQFITVRFGNVLGSSGSVIPLFKKQSQIIKIQTY